MQEFESASDQLGVASTSGDIKIAKGCIHLAVDDNGGIHPE